MPDDRDQEHADALDPDIEAECDHCGEVWWTADQGEYCPNCGSADWAAVRDWA